ncbi:hypothetical protein C8R46DRAFT_1034882 [Mycena filopes]|nr:hypothetical protein C8R46DRAFT_1034882 [Mycena filopes]
MDVVQDTSNNYCVAFNIGLINLEEVHTTVMVLPVHPQSLRNDRKASATPEDVFESQRRPRKPQIPAIEMNLRTPIPGARCSERRTNKSTEENTVKVVWCTSASDSPAQQDQSRCGCATPSWLALHDAVRRLTATPVFRNYQWRSEAFITDTWRMAKVDEAITKFFDTLLRLDQEGFPPDSLTLDDATFRAHLGLPSSCNVTIDPEKGYNSKAAGAFWISLLRFQVLDLLLSMTHGVSDTPSPKEPPPTATGPVSVVVVRLDELAHLLESLKNKYAKDTKAADPSKPSTAEAVKSLIPAGAVVPEAFTPLLALTDMHAVTLATKTSKNFQTMGTALMWILECNTTNPFDIPTTMKIGDTFDCIGLPMCTVKFSDLRWDSSTSFYCFAPTVETLSWFWPPSHSTLAMHSFSTTARADPAPHYARSCAIVDTQMREPSLRHQIIHFIFIFNLSQTSRRRGGFPGPLRVFVVISDTQKRPLGRGGFAAIAQTLISSAECIPSNRWRSLANESPAEKHPIGLVVYTLSPPLLMPEPQLAAPLTARPPKIPVAVVISQTCQIDTSLSSTSMPSLPNEHWPFRLHTHLETTSVVPTSLFFPLDGKVCVHIRGAGPNHVFLSFEGVGNTGGSPNLLEIPNVDTLLAAVDTTRSSWTWKSKLALITIKLCFPSSKHLHGFLFALSYVRLSDFTETRLPSPIPLPETRPTQQDIQRFSEMRASVYGRQATIAVLPVEVLSEIFSLLPSSGHRRSNFASTLLPLRVCSEWRSVAIGTATLWRTPPTFTLTPSFFYRGGGAQALLWLNRAKGSNVTLSIKSPLNSAGISNAENSRVTRILSAERGGPEKVEEHWMVRKEDDVETKKLEGGEEGSDWPYQGEGWIKGEGWDRRRWVHLLTQCTSLETGRFALFNEEASPPCPLAILTLAHLVSLRLRFFHVRDTRFFDHLSLPRLSNLHVEGTLVDAANIDFVANYPALRHLTVDLDLFDNGLQHLIQRSIPLERLAGFRGDGVQRLRSFTVVTSTLFTAQTRTDKFIKTSPSWIVTRVLGGCDFQLYGEAALLDQFRLALGVTVEVRAVDPMVKE